MGFSSILSIALVLAPGSEAFLSARGAMPLASSRASPAAFRSTSLAPRQQQCNTKSLKMSTAAAPVVAGGSTAAPV
ncbi:unnamed protein product, partial [Ectocarpus sp. 12 AP-2014]